MLAKRFVKQVFQAKNVGAGRRSYYEGPHKKVTMNDLPVPSGDWYELHARRNAKYNVWLAAGVLSLVGTIGFVKATGVINFNYSPPSSLD